MARIIVAALVPVIIAPVFADSSSGQQGIDKAREAGGNCRGLNVAQDRISGTAQACPVG